MHASEPHHPADPDGSPLVDSEQLPETGPDNGIWVLTATILASTMAFIDATVVNIALPAMQTEFGVGLDQIQWVIENYALLLSALILLGGSLGDRFGRRRVFVIGTLSFAAASVLCAIAPNLLTLNIARGLQGVGAALLVPSSLAVISASFPPSKRGAAIGTWTAFSAVTTAMGPPLGGLVIEFVSWRWIFMINAPLALVVGWITRTKIRESFGRSCERIDIAGALLVTASLGGIVYGLIAWGEGRSGPSVWGTLALGTALMGGFLTVEARSPNAMLPLQFFRNTSFSSVNAMTLLIYAALSGLLYFLPFNLIQVRGWSAPLAGAAFLPFAGIIFVLARYGGRLADTLGPRVPLTVGSIITGLGYAGFGYFPRLIPNYPSAIALATLILAVGMAIIVPPLTTVAITSVDDGFAGVASGVNNAIARLANLVGVAIFTVIALQVFTAAFDDALTQSSLPAGVADSLREQSTMLAAIEIDPAWEPATQATSREIVGEAFTYAFEVTCYFAAILVWVAAILAAVGIGSLSPRRQKRSTATHFG